MTSWRERSNRIGPCPRPKKQKPTPDPKNNLHLCFFGDSGAGKTTCFKMVEDFYSEINRDIYVGRVDVAGILREIQVDIYEKLRLPSCGQPNYPESFAQDAKLMEFLAENYMPSVLNCFEVSCNKIKYSAIFGRNNFVIVNTDCRNNAYETLNKLGFVFIRVDTAEDIRANRLKGRKDVNKPSASATNSCDQIKENFVISNNGTLEELKGAVYNVLKRIQEAQNERPAEGGNPTD